jgi:alpha/beta superfamily hydrolase
MEQPIYFPSGDIDLEGRLFWLSEEKAAVITHPHPLMGGDMDNGVVGLIAEAYRAAGWSTLRFNFRGAGRSGGSHDEGVGEQDDLQAAIDELTRRGARCIDLAGYSFGTWIISRWAQRHADHPHRLLLVAPPVDYLPFDAATIPGLRAVFVGDRDDFAAVAHIQ